MATIDYRRCTQAQYVCMDVSARCHRALQIESKLRVLCSGSHIRKSLFYGDSRDEERTPLHEPLGSSGGGLVSLGFGRKQRRLYKLDLSVFAKARAAPGGAEVVGREE